jgi:nucleolar protein 14
MGKSKRQNRSKRSLASLPKGLVHKDAATMNPFEEMASRQKKPKQIVHNRPVSKAKTTKNTLESLQRRQTQLRSTLKASTKANSFVDRRIGQYDPTMSKDDQMLARLVRERSRQSKRQTKFQLDDDGDDAAAAATTFGGNGSRDLLTLTHKGKPLDPNQKVSSRDVNLLSDDEDDDVDRGNLAAVDTELHFGGGRISSQQRNDPYGGGSGAHHTDLSQVYSARKTELDDLILRRKTQKAERMETKEAQVDKIDQMDESFAELSALLRFRKNEPPPAKGSAGVGGAPPKPTQEEIEMNEWQRDMRQIMSKPKHKASDRTKTPEEIAKEQSEKLHELETRRLARMNGDFSDDDFSDISVNGDGSNNNKKSKKKTSKKKKESVKDKRQRNPDELSDSENEEDDGKLEARFTSEGLVYIDKEGKVVKTPVSKEPEDSKEEAESSSSEEDDEDDEDGSDDDSEGEEDDDAKAESEETKVFHVGDQIRGNFHAAEQFDGREAWYEGVIAKVQVQPDGSHLYDVEYDDGDCEEDMTPKNIRLMDESAVEEEDKKVTQKELTNEEQLMQRKRKKARDKARYVRPPKLS